MRIALIQLGYDDAAPLAERTARAADLVRAQRGARPRGAARAVGARRVRLPRLGRARRARRRADRARRCQPPPATPGWCCTPGPSSSARPTASAAPRARTCGTPRWSSAPTAPCWRPTARSTGSASAQGEPSLMEAGDEVAVVDLPDGAGGTRARRAVHLLRPALPRALPRPARRRRHGVRHPRRRGRRPGSGTGPCWPGPARSRTSASSSPATRPAPTRAP